MMVINGAYKTLKDPIKRAEYDKKRLRKQETLNNKSTKTATSQHYSKDYSYRRSVQSKDISMDDLHTTTNNKKTIFDDILNNSNYRSDENTEPIGSIKDIIGEVWNDFTISGGENFMKDLSEFLDKQVIIVFAYTSIYLYIYIFMYLYVNNIYLLIYISDAIIICF